MTENNLIFGPVGRNSAHLCVDMQRMFAEPTEWMMPWWAKVLPHITALVIFQPEKTIFTRFIPARRAGQGHGMWKQYYERWASMTVEKIGADMLELVPALARYTPPASVIDKHVYAPWLETELHQRLQRQGIDTLIISGGETDVCVCLPPYWERLIWDIGLFWLKMPYVVRPTRRMMPRSIYITSAIAFRLNR